MARRARSLRRQLARFFLVLGLVMALAAGAIGLALVESATDQARVTDVLEPARVGFRDLFTALVDQETGVRGFALTGDPAFLEPYEAGRAQAGVQQAALADLLADEPALLGALDDLLAAHQRWHAEAALPTIAGAQIGAGLDPLLLDTSRLAFEEVRDRFDDLLVAIRAERVEAEAGIRASRRLLTGGLLATPPLLAASALVLWLGLRRSVIEPIEQLGGVARRVSAGELGLPVTVSGPAPTELEQLAIDLDAMRDEIVADLARVEAARDELERTNAELEQFAYVASHDLQEPLWKVASFCELLQKRYGGQLDERADEYIAFAVDGAKRMQQLITDLLDFSRVGRVGAERGPVDCRAVAATAVSDLARVIEDAGATVVIGDLPTVTGDRSLLTSLFQNLVANAVKFRHPERPPQVELGARAAGDGWELWCRDNGIGIEPRFAERVFLVFQRLHGRSAYTGTGIGLALCRKIVEHHGGRIWIDVDGDTAAGTTVWWTLPTEA